MSPSARTSCLFQNHSIWLQNLLRVHRSFVPLPVSLHSCQVSYLSFFVLLIKQTDLPDLPFATAMNSSSLFKLETYENLCTYGVIIPHSHLKLPSTTLHHTSTNCNNFSHKQVLKVIQQPSTTVQFTSLEKMALPAVFAFLVFAAVLVVLVFIAAFLYGRTIRKAQAQRALHAVENEEWSRGHNGTAPLAPQQAHVRRGRLRDNT